MQNKVVSEYVHAMPSSTFTNVETFKIYLMIIILGNIFRMLTQSVFNKYYQTVIHMQVQHCQNLMN